ncbi:MAG: serine/threonine-protein kinase [Xenococcaceae cyanobacterium MO_207.B15]|nr:serine/threonine-protein kinase [Xenococcaceae cyanobacterium MO_207.B15]
MIWKPGVAIQGGKYVIEEVLGVGGFGVTYRAKDTFLDKLVAIKTANDLIQTKPNFDKQQEKFVQEAFRLAKCSHTHIIKVNDVCREEELWCMVMEYVTGGDLEQKVIHQGILASQSALKYIQQIGDALTYIHQQGLLHRDVKPSNIMLRQHTGEAVLIDFGLAREFVDGRFLTHTNARTECYAPIEQYEVRAKRGAYTDVYALAATCYFLLTGEQPLPAQFRYQGAKLIPPKQHNPQISDRLNQAILQGMKLAPEQRPQSIPEWFTILLNTTNHKVLDLETKYSRLKALLVAQNWQQADEETYDLMLKIANRVKEGWLDYESTQKLPCDFLESIDRLWVEHSNGRFGFSVQKHIWQKLGGKIDYKTECSLGEHLGWRDSNGWLDSSAINYTLNAPVGHLPWNGHLPQGQLKQVGLLGSYARWWSCLILSRCGECSF